MFAATVSDQVSDHSLRPNLASLFEDIEKQHTLSFWLIYIHSTYFA